MTLGREVNQFAQNAIEQRGLATSYWAGDCSYGFLLYINLEVFEYDWSIFVPLEALTV